MSWARIMWPFCAGFAWELSMATRSRCFQDWPKARPISPHRTASCTMEPKWPSNNLKTNNERRTCRKIGAGVHGLQINGAFDDRVHGHWGVQLLSDPQGGRTPDRCAHGGYFCGLSRGQPYRGGVENIQTLGKDHFQ